MAPSSVLRCPVCSHRARRLGDLQGVDNERYTACECTYCHLRFAAPDGGDWDLHYHDIYNEEFYDSLAVSPEERLRQEARVVDEQLKFLSRYLPTPGRALDVGAGDGVHLKLLRDAGWEVAGTEVSQSAVDRAYHLWGISLQLASIQDADLPEESFDYVQLRHVIEHLTVPQDTLCKIHMLLKPGGILKLDTTTRGWADATREALERSLSSIRRTGTAVHISNLAPPEHNLWFTRSAARILLEECGFTIVKVIQTYKGDPRHYPTKIYRDRDLNLKGRIESAFVHILDTLASRVHRGSVLVVYARKPA